MNIRSQNILILTVAAMLMTAPHWARMLGLGMGSSAIEVTEGRRLAALPDFKSVVTGNLDKNLRDIDTALEDNLWHRADVIAAMSRIGTPLGQSVSEKVVVGKQGWLFNDRKILLNALDPDRDTKRRVEAVRASLLSLQDRLDQQDIPLILVVVPSKRTVYPEYLPNWARLEDPSRTLNEMADSLAADFTVMNLYEPLVEAKTDHPTYYKTDSHWNEWGAFVGFQEIIKRMPTALAPIPAPSSNAFAIADETYDEGDFARMLYQSGSLAEIVPNVTPDFPTRVLSEERRQDYPAKWGWSRIARSDTGNPSRVMILGDSFSLWLEPYFEQFFDVSVRALHQRGRFDSCLLEEMSPDIVIFQIVEQRISAGFQTNSDCAN